MLSPTTSAELLRDKLAKLLATVPIPRYVYPITVDASHNGTYATLTIVERHSLRSDHSHLSKLTVADLAVLSVVREEVERRRRRMIGRDVVLAMKRRKIHRSASSISHSLAALTTVGALINANDKRGYGIP